MLFGLHTRNGVNEIHGGTQLHHNNKIYLLEDIYIYIHRHRIFFFLVLLLIDIHITPHHLGYVKFKQQLYFVYKVQVLVI